MSFRTRRLFQLALVFVLGFSGGAAAQKFVFEDFRFENFRFSQAAILPAQLALAENQLPLNGSSPVQLDRLQLLEKPELLETSLLANALIPKLSATTSLATSLDLLGLNNPRLGLELAQSRAPAALLAEGNLLDADALLGLDLPAELLLPQGRGLLGTPARLSAREGLLNLVELGRGIDDNDGTA